MSNLLLDPDEDEDKSYLEYEKENFFKSDDKVVGDILLTDLKKFLTKKSLSPYQSGEVIWELHKDHYIEKPVDIITFSEDPHFLGGTLEEGHFPLWHQKCLDLYPHPLFSPYYEVVAEAPIGAGKSQWGGAILLYELYKMSLQYDPQRFYNLLQNTLIAFTVMSQDLSTAGDVNWSILEGYISESPFFREIVTLPKGKDAPNELKFPNKVALKFASKPSHLTGRAVFGGICDEANVSRYIFQIYKDVIKRMNSRFPLSKNGGILPGKLLLLSSPKEEGSFLAERIKNKSIFTMIITNIPIWTIKGAKKLNLCGDNFQVFTGNETKEPYLVKKEVMIPEEDKPFILDVPIEYYRDFFIDIVEALQECAGIRTAGKGKLFRSENYVRACLTAPNECTHEIIELDFVEEQDKIINYFKDLAFFRDCWHPTSKRFLHIDVGINNDKLGLGCAHATEKEMKYYNNDQQNNLIENLELLNKISKKFLNVNGVDSIKTVKKYWLDFVIAIKKPQNEEVSIPKVIDFILTLKNDLRFPITNATTDNFEGRTLKQFLRQHQIETGYLSIDRNYEVWKLIRALFLLQQIIGPQIEFLIKEIMGLEDNGKTFDHPDYFQDGTSGSHDMTQGAFGAIFNCATSVNGIYIPNAFMEELSSINKYGDDLKGTLRKNYIKYNKDLFYKNFTG